MPETEVAVAQQLAGEPFDAAVWGRHRLDWMTCRLAGGAGLGGPRTTISTACSSSAEAIAVAARWLRAGRAERMVAGGCDLLSRHTLNGFASLLAVDPAGCRPFSTDRAGMSLGEAAAFLILEPRAAAESRGAQILALLAGAGNSCDAHHATAPDPDGRGAEQAMRAALAEAAIEPAAVDAINAHGTGTLENDRAEGRAIRRLFGPVPPLTSSTKGIFGHPLGAAGAVEAVVSILALLDQQLPGTCGLGELDPACEIEPLRAPRDHAVRAVLSNSFAFGGNNTALCFRHLEALR
jgi:3-oxoacyl-(acyl-carrier-protein) synthase